MESNISLDLYLKYLTSLRNRIWKLLPIYEGIDQQKKVIFPKDVAYENFLKNLRKLITEIKGAEKIEIYNEFYIELRYLLSGIEEFTPDEHERLKYNIQRCADLCELMKKDARENYQSKE